MRCALQLIRKPDRDWNPVPVSGLVSNLPCYNSLENPIGIETISRRGRTPPGARRYNSLENPIGIETVSPDMQRRAGGSLQLIRKPDRDWN